MKTVRIAVRGAIFTVSEKKAREVLRNEPSAYRIIETPTYRSQSDLIALRMKWLDQQIAGSRL